MVSQLVLEFLSAIVPVQHVAKGFSLLIAITLNRIYGCDMSTFS